MLHGDLIARALALGVVTGMRSVLGLALLAWLGGPNAAPGWIESLGARLATSLLAAVELVADKLPKTPSRLAPGPLAARLVFGGVCGGLLVMRTQASLWPGVALGAIGALAGAFAGNRVRAYLGRRTGWPDLVFALGEDAIAIALGVWAIL